MRFSREVASRALESAKREEAARYLASGKKDDVSVLMMHRVKPCGQRRAHWHSFPHTKSQRASTLLTKINNYQQLRRRGRKSARCVQRARFVGFALCTHQVWVRNWHRAKIRSGHRQLLWTMGNERRCSIILAPIDFQHFDMKTLSLHGEREQIFIDEVKSNCYRAGIHGTQNVDSLKHTHAAPRGESSQHGDLRSCRSAFCAV
jgi:hypothetical protein